MKKVLGALLIGIVLTSVACIFGRTSKRVMSYRDDKVYLSFKDHFSVGSLPKEWKRMRVRAHSIAFHNPDLKATIATDAFCGPSFEDLPLLVLASQVTAGVEDYDVASSDEFALDGRGALRTVGRGKVDGVPLVLDIVVIKKNRCIVDFMCVSPEDGYYLAAPDFETFYNGFHYE